MNKNNLFSQINGSFIIVTLIFGVIMMLSFKKSIHGQVVCFGDSITHGSEANGFGWVQFLKTNHPDIDFINSGRNGRKTSDKKELEKMLVDYPNANYYLIFLGVNDLKDANDSLVNNCVTNVKWMIEKIKSVNENAEVVILSPSSINLKTMSEINVKKKYNGNTKKALKTLEGKYKKLAKQMDVGFISLLHTVSNGNYLDGLHPNKAGESQIADAVWKGLNKLF